MKKTDDKFNILLQYTIISILLLILLALIGVIKETENTIIPQLTNYRLVLNVFAIFELILGLFVGKKASILGTAFLFFGIDLLLMFAMMPIGEIFDSPQVGLIKISAIFKGADEQNLLSPILLLHIPYIIGSFISVFQNKIVSNWK